jgi:starvation-inducible DNA-binding protein
MSSTLERNVSGAEPHVHQRGREIQPFGTVIRTPIALSESVRLASVGLLNQALADTMTLRDMYKKHHWQTAGATFYQLHLLYDKHYEEQAEIIDSLAERVQTLGGLAIAMAADVAEMTLLPRPPRGRETVGVQISRLLEAHEMLLLQVRSAAEKVAALGDQGTNDLLVSQVIRTNETQVWFLAQHLVSSPT